MFRLVLSLVVAVFAVVPAMAQSSSISISEPSDGALFAIGVAGLIVGRQVARKRK